MIFSLFQQLHKICLLVVISLIILGCKSNGANSSKTPIKKNTKVDNKAVSKSIRDIDTLNEDFNVFFKRFDSDSIFQLERIIFPLKVTYKSEDGSSDSTATLMKNKWRYVHLTAEKNAIIKKVRTLNKTVNVQFFIEDTGIDVNHFFVNKQGKWWLSHVVDQSD